MARPRHRPWRCAGRNTCWKCRHEKEGKMMITWIIYLSSCHLLQFFKGTLMHTYINIFIIELELVLFHTNISAPYLCSIRFASAHSVARPAAAMLSVSPASLRNWWRAKVSRDANVKAQRPRCSKQPDHGEPCWGHFWMASKSLTWRKSTSRIGWMFNIVLNPGYFRWNDVRLEPVTICLYIKNTSREWANWNPGLVERRKVSHRSHL